MVLTAIRPNEAKHRAISTIHVESGLGGGGRGDEVDEEPELMMLVDRGDGVVVGGVWVGSP